MIGWILGGLAVATIGKALMDDAGNNSNRSDNNGSDNNIMWIQCPFCNSEMSINQSLDRRHITCAKCQKKFVVDRRIPINNLLVVQCVSCGRDVEVQTNSDEKATCKHCGAVFEYEKYKTVSCASCGKWMKVPAFRYAEIKCDNCGTVFNSDKGTLYKKTNGEDQNTVSNSHSKNSQELCVIRCPKCNQGLRVPTNKKIEVTCNSCSNIFISDNGIVIDSDGIDVKHKKGTPKNIVNSDKKTAGYYVYAPRIEEHDLKNTMMAMLLACNENKHGLLYKNEKDNMFLGLETVEELSNFSASRIVILMEKTSPFIISAYFEENDIILFYSSLTQDHYAIITTIKLLYKENYKTVHTFAACITNEELYRKCRKFVEPNRISYEDKWSIILGFIFERMTSDSTNEGHITIDGTLAEFAQSDS